MPQSESAHKFQRELNAGVTALLVLGLVKQTGRPIYGYEVALRLSGLADDDLPMSQGALYPVLRSLEKQKLLSSHIEPSNSGPPRRYYSLTAAGEQALAEWTAVWRQTENLVNRVLESQHGHRKRNAPRRSEIS
jgi:PadR family transcriptional regulator PadR